MTIAVSEAKPKCFLSGSLQTSSCEQGHCPPCFVPTHTSTWGVVLAVFLGNFKRSPRACNVQRGLESLGWDVELPRKCLLNAVKKAGLGTHSWPELPQRLWEVCRDARWVPEAQLPGGFPSCQLLRSAPAENPREGKGVPAARRPRLQLHRNISDLVQAHVGPEEAVWLAPGIPQPPLRSRNTG